MPIVFQIENWNNKKKTLTIEVDFNSISNCNKLLKAIVKCNSRPKTNFNSLLFICTVSGVFDSKNTYQSEQPE